MSADDNYDNRYIDHEDDYDDEYIHIDDDSDDDYTDDEEGIVQNDRVSRRGREIRHSYRYPDLRATSHHDRVLTAEPTDKR